MDYITLKRFEFDKIRAEPDIPEEIIKEFNNNFRTVSVHKPDPVIDFKQYCRLVNLRMNGEKIIYKR